MKAVAVGALIRDREREAAAAAPGGEAGDSEKPRRRRQVSPFKHLNVTQFISDHATLSWIAENSTFTCTYRDHEMSNHLINRPHGTILWLSFLARFPLNSLCLVPYCCADSRGYTRLCCIYSSLRYCMNNWIDALLTPYPFPSRVLFLLCDHPSWRIPSPSPKEYIIVLTTY